MAEKPFKFKSNNKFKSHKESLEELKFASYGSAFSTVYSSRQLLLDYQITNLLQNLLVLVLRKQITLL